MGQCSLRTQFIEICHLLPDVSSPTKAQPEHSEPHAARVNGYATHAAHRDMRLTRAGAPFSCGSLINLRDAGRFHALTLGVAAYGAGQHGVEPAARGGSRLTCSQRLQVLAQWCLVLRARPTCCHARLSMRLTSATSPWQIVWRTRRTTGTAGRFRARACSAAATTARAAWTSHTTLASEGHRDTGRATAGTHPYSGTYRPYAMLALLHDAAGFKFSSLPPSAWILTWPRSPPA